MSQTLAEIEVDKQAAFTQSYIMQYPIAIFGKMVHNREDHQKLLTEYFDKLTGGAVAVPVVAEPEPQIEDEALPIEALPDAFAAFEPSAEQFADEAQDAASPEVVAKRGPGRPPKKV